MLNAIKKSDHPYYPSMQSNRILGFPATISIPYGLSQPVCEVNHDYL